MSTGMWIKPLEKWMQCFDTFGFSYAEGEMRMCFFSCCLAKVAAPDNKGNTTNIRMSKIRCLLEIWRTTSALPSWNVSHPMPSNYECCWKSQPVQFCFLVPLKRRFYPKPLKATCSQNFPKLFSLPRFGYFRIYPFPKQKKSPQTQQQNQRQKRC